MNSRFIFFMRLIKGQVNKAYIVISLLSLILLAFNATAKESTKINRKYEFNIPVQSLSESLNQLSDIAKISFLFPYNLVENKEGKSVQGKYTVQQALTMLLKSTNLEGVLSGKRAFLIKPLTTNKNYNNNFGEKQMKSQKTLLATIFTLMFSSTGNAEEAQAPLSASAQEEKKQNVREKVIGLEVIEVTAQKRTQSMQEVPIAISVLSGEELTNQGISDFQGLSERTPGLLIGAFSPAQPEISIRGIGTKEDGPGANDSTVVSVDDVYIASRIAQIIDIYDLDRVEVLRGPQGTLYGRNSIAGSINFVTRKPDEYSLFKFEQTVGQHNKVDTRAMVTGAINEDSGFFGKLSYSRRAYDGYVDLFADKDDKIGEINGIDRQSLRGQLRFKPDDKLDMILTIEGETDDDQGQNREPRADVTADPARNAIAINQALGGESLYNSFATEGFLRRDVFGTNLKVDYNFDDFTLTSITAYRDAEVETGIDCCGLNGVVYPRSNYDYVDEKADQITQELRLSGETDDLTWVTGVFYTDESDRRLEGFGFGPVGDPQGSFQEITDSSAFANVSDVNAEIEAIALYAQGTYKLSEKSNLTIGLRYSTEEKVVTSSGSVTGGPPSGIIVGPFAPVVAENDWSSTDFRVAYDYNLSKDMLFYGSVASGFKSGGFTGSPKTASTASKPFDEENALNYEIGFKSTLLDNTLRFNLAGFFTDYEDLQVTRFALTPQTSTFGEFLTENAAGAEIKGLELETTWLPVDDLVISFNWAYLDAKFTEFSGLTPAPDGTPVDYTGNRLRQSPEHSGSINVKYDWWGITNDDDRISLNLSTRYVDDTFYDPDNNPRTVVDAYAVGDIRLSYISATEKYRVDFWVNNFTDKEYTTHIFSLTGGQRSFANAGKPRWYGVTFTYTLED